MIPGQDVLDDLDTALAREWLLTNGLGGYAAGTASGASTRRSHGLLIAAGPHGRLATLLLKLDEILRVESESFELASTVRAGGQLRPAGHRLIEEFRLEPWPTWRLRAGPVLLEKSVFVIHEHNAVAISYRHLDGPSARLTVSPLIAARDPLALEAEDPSLRGVATGIPGRVRLETRAEWPNVTLWHNGAFIPARIWLRDLFYPADGLDDGAEDALVPGHIEATLSKGLALHVVASAEDELFRVLAREDRLGTPPPKTLAECIAALERDERGRLSAWKRSALLGADYTARQAAAAHGGAADALARRREPLVDEHDPWAVALARSLQHGLAHRGSRLTLLGAYPGGEERGAETLPALAGLIALRAFGEVREVLRGYTEYLDEGLAPESFDPGTGRPRYADPMPALWLVHASDLFARRSEDLEFLKETLYAGLDSIMQFYRSGTRGGLHVEADGLLSAGEGEHAERRADLNALWYHALVAMAQLARLVGRRESGAFYLAWANAHQKRFNEAMWDQTAGCLVHALNGRGVVRGLTPSQILAVSLPPTPLPPDRARRLIGTIERELFTPLGLRPGPGADEVSSRWLGPFYSAWLRTRGRDAAAQRRVHEWLDLSRARLIGGEPGLGDTAPRVDGARSRFSILCAAELLRVQIEELDPITEKAASAG